MDQGRNKGRNKEQAIKKLTAKSPVRSVTYDCHFLKIKNGIQ